ncbi:uncharacterized protein M421DRAFT_269127 [Didymella exigua CBS 183.55]|uniref:RNA-binding domain-containing protein n=1 Tax=Didymella exigua CBS 183.55 TaxID=1150837 RepID=A0A6A5REF9_9PLEO|nr:uncharacterized protein M421DRAFT_269127 [Didymella exigua CBS 183.55]KAF1924916.1 hypothetical protein M421DRAFT_269127 [Didymella exigua CBS 183.55]
MLLPEEDSEVFKRWVLPKLETISDADGEVLADYVVALVTTKETDANIRRNCLESLSDFLQDHTASFVDEVIRTLKSKSYASANTNVRIEAPAQIPSIVGTSTAEYLPHPANASNTAPLHAPRGPAASRASNGHRLLDRPTGVAPGANVQQDGQRSRKRKQDERDTSQSREGLDRRAGNDRPLKQAARRGKNGRAGGLNAQAAAFAPMPNMPPFNPSFGEIPPFDPGNPMAFLAMAAAFGINLPGMPPMPAFNAETSNIRCADYDTKGFCAAGSTCPYRHNLEYDPDQPAQGDANYTQTNRTYYGRPNGGRARAPFSLPGSTRDRANTTIVVEQIPEDNFSEEDVRYFFGTFGTILDIRMQAYKRLAVVKYETHDAASAAYNSPKAVFDNRFVKVYWHRSDADLDAEGQGSYDETEMLDPEEVERRQAEAQKAFEERRKKEEEAAAKADEVDRKLQETNTEILRIRRELARVSGKGNGDVEEDFSQDLAILQAEAENLFAQQDAAAESWRGSGRGGYRGAHRGRGYAPRARGFRGGYRGRGAFAGARTGVKRLDNRPRRIAIKGVEPGSRKDEALRQHLFNVPDVVSTEHYPEHANILVINFDERYQAEAFIDTAHQIPDAGKLEMEWVPNDAFGGAKAAEGDAGGHDSDSESATVEVKQENAATDEPVGAAADADMDVAEDEDQWL